MQGQRPILFVLFVTAIQAVKIEYFGAYRNFPEIGNRSTVEANNMHVWANVTECEPTGCLCEVTGTASTTAMAMNFTTGVPGHGFVYFDGLQPETEYSLTLICVSADKPVQIKVKTDYGRPSPPQTISAAIVAGRVRLSWTRPATPAGPIHHYRLKVNSNPTMDDLPSDKLYYDTKEDYVYGTRYTFVLSACNMNYDSHPVCSDPNEGLITFTAVGTTTPSRPPTGAANGLANSILFPVLMLGALALS